MAEYREYISALRQCAKEHEKDKLYTMQINTSGLCNDTAKLLENDVIERSKINKAIDKIKGLSVQVDKIQVLKILQECIGE